MHGQYNTDVCGFVWLTWLSRCDVTAAIVTAKINTTHRDIPAIFFTQMFGRALAQQLRKAKNTFFSLKSCFFKNQKTLKNVKWFFRTKKYRRKRSETDNA